MDAIFFRVISIACEARALNAACCFNNDGSIIILKIEIIPKPYLTNAITQHMPPLTTHYATTNITALRLIHNETIPSQATIDINCSSSCHFKLSTVISFEII